MQLLQQRYETTELSVKLKTEINSGNKIKMLSKENQDEFTRLNESRDLLIGIEEEIPHQQKSDTPSQKITASKVTPNSKATPTEKVTKEKVINLEKEDYKILARNSNGGRYIPGKRRRVNRKAGDKRKLLFNDDEPSTTTKRRKLEKEEMNIYRIDNINRYETSLIVIADAGCESGNLVNDYKSFKTWLKKKM